MNYDEFYQQSMKFQYDECMQRVPVTFKFLGMPWYGYLCMFLVVRVALSIFGPKLQYHTYLEHWTGISFSPENLKISSTKIAWGVSAYGVLSLIMIYFLVCLYRARKNRRRVYKIDALKANTGPVDFPDFKREEIKGFSKERLDSFDIVEARKRAAAVDLGPGLDLNFGL